ncbi:MAG: hypothetical protein ACYDBX_02375 [Patescibacteria group bacterium]
MNQDKLTKLFFGLLSSDTAEKILKEIESYEQANDPTIDFLEYLDDIKDLLITQMPDTID